MMVSEAITGAAPIFSIFLNEKSSPREKSRKMTPMSAHVCTSARSITDIVYGICGLTINPATIYPSTSGCLSLLNSKVTVPATTRISAKSFTNSGNSAIFPLNILIFQFFNFLIPLHRIAIAASLVVFERIGERGGITAEREVIACVGRQHQLARHIEAMEVASQRCRCH